MAFPQLSFHPIPHLIPLMFSSISRIQSAPNPLPNQPISHPRATLPTTAWCHVNYFFQLMVFSEIVWLSHERAQFICLSSNPHPPTPWKISSGQILGIASMLLISTPRVQLTSVHAYFFFLSISEKAKTLSQTFWVLFFFFPLPWMTTFSGQYWWTLWHLWLPAYIYRYLALSRVKKLILNKPIILCLLMVSS